MFRERENAKVKSKRAKATDISQKVKKIVWKRDNHACVICGNTQNVMPNAHYIPRSQGGLGIPENIVTLCTEFTENQCHRRFDFGAKEEREQIGTQIEKYLKTQYPNWDKSEIVYNKFKNLELL